MYEHTVTQLRKRILNKHPHAKANSYDQNPDKLHEYKQLYNYFLWMLQEIEKMKDPLKTRSWLIWVSTRMEMMGDIKNEQTRNWIREDKNAAEEYAEEYYVTKRATKEKRIKTQGLDYF
jgi:acyl-CoA thioesterase